MDFDKNIIVVITYIAAVCQPLHRRYFFSVYISEWA
jgi:hypothetical protein